MLILVNDQSSLGSPINLSSKPRSSLEIILPVLGLNPDDGVRIGFVENFTTYGLQRNPFTAKHSLSASYYTGNSGYDISYKGEFSNIFHNWNFAVEGKYTSPNFAQNFFGFGNDTTYDKDDVELDFNRISIREWGTSISLIWKGRHGGSFYFKPLIESFEVQNVPNRFINISSLILSIGRFFKTILQSTSKRSSPFRS